MHLSKTRHCVMTTDSTENSYFADNLDRVAQEPANSGWQPQAAETALLMGGPPDAADNVTYLPNSPCASVVGSGGRPPTQDAEAADQPDDGHGEDGGSDNGGSEYGGSEDDEDLDVLPFDELDEATAQHKEDWRLPTVAWPESVNGEDVFNDTVGIFNRFMILPEGAAEILSLWVFSTYALRACNLPFAVRLMITAQARIAAKRRCSTYSPTWPGTRSRPRILPRRRSTDPSMDANACCSTRPTTTCRVARAPATS
jgi:hypothetical protein